MSSADFGLVTTKAELTLAPRSLNTEAYKWDEIAASVMVMQGASALDDLAEKVLRIGELMRP